MALIKKFYFCNHCKKIVSKLDDLLFVEDGGQRGFCSESCIEKFFNPLIDYFHSLIDKERKNQKIHESELQALLNDPKLMERSFRRPSEVWRVENDIHEELYAFISHQTHEKYGRIHVIILCFLFNRQPSFVFLSTVTKSDKLLNYFQIGEEIKDLDSFFGHSVKEPKNMSSEISVVLERQKSLVLAELLSVRKDSDIPFERFTLFDKYMEKTLSAPDEVYEQIIDNDFVTHSYIRSFQDNSDVFYYIIILLLPKEYDDETELFPIVSFPTRDADVYKKFSSGKQIHGQFKS